MTRLLLITASLLALGACGGGGASTGSGGSASTGGGGASAGSSSFDFSNPATVLPGQPLPEGAVVVPMTFVSSEFTSDDSISAFSGPGAGSVATSRESTTAEGGSDAIRFTADGNTIESGPDVNAGEDVNNTVEVLTDADGTMTWWGRDDPDFEYTAYAGWSQSPNPDGEPVPGQKVYFGAIGAPITTLPNGSASYSGKSIGMDNAGGEIRLTRSDVTVSTDFSTVTVNSRNTFAQDVTVERGTTVRAPELDIIDATGQITNGGYAATADGMTVNGAFFGPNAEETAGTFHGTSQGGSNYGGAFGAIKN